MLGSPEALKELLVTARESLQVSVPQIAERLLDGDVVGASQMLHGIKGFLPIFCTADLAQRVGVTELASRSGLAVQLAEKYVGLRGDLEVLLGEISAYVERA